jgi:hypothetical protein
MTPSSVYVYRLKNILGCMHTLEGSLSWIPRSGAKDSNSGQWENWAESGPCKGHNGLSSHNCPRSQLRKAQA